MCLLLTVFIVKVLTECVLWDVHIPVNKYEGEEASIVMLILQITKLSFRGGRSVLKSESKNCRTEMKTQFQSLNGPSSPTVVSPRGLG